jgi:hypothetical protein
MIRTPDLVEFELSYVSASVKRDRLTIGPQVGNLPHNGAPV